MKGATDPASPVVSPSLPVDEGTLRVAPLLALPGLLADLGQDPQAILAEAGIDPRLLDDPENLVAFADLGRLLALGAAPTGCPHLGLSAARSLGPQVLGPLGGLLACAPDLGTALHQATLYLHLHDRGAVPTLWSCGDRALLAYTIHQPDVPGTEQIYDGALAISFNLLRALAGTGFAASEVRLPRAAPADPEPYRRHFRTRICFGAEHAAVAFDSSWLARPLGGANPALHERMLREIQSLESRGAGDPATQIKRVLRRLPIDGASHGETTLARIATAFSIHRRTLNRRLKDQGTSFKALIDEARYDIARQLLRDTGLSVSDVASALHYADAAAFSRAFRRWSGTSPAAWRNSRSQSPAPEPKAVWVTDPCRPCARED